MVFYKAVCVKCFLEGHKHFVNKLLMYLSQIIVRLKICLVVLHPALNLTCSSAILFSLLIQYHFQRNFAGVAVRSFGHG